MLEQTNSAAQQRMVELLYSLAPNEGYTQSLLEGVRFMRSNRPLRLTPVLYEPSIVIVCQGRKRGYLGSEVYVYDAMHYLVLSVPLPFISETDASPDEPLLAVSIRLNMATVAELVSMVEHGEARSMSSPQCMFSTPLKMSMTNATVRLLEALRSPEEAQVLAPSIVREICYRVLVDEQGGAVRTALAQQGQFGRIAKALNRIHADFAEPLEVGRLASEVGMSTSVFHVHFKAVTQNTPLQYIKSTRLHHARMMMIRDGLPAAAAAMRVGYESPSQFSREFKRFFGRPPGEEVREMKALLTLLPPERIEALAVPH
ncbi:AraC family transcriptional regulator [Marinobacter sp. THAF197a]|uniref:AraC family transcriptional regulator n=2 Tax=unclassified Marinobacter TaxID=83889 RepID=UPI0012A93A60|nr:AraC family transcriptional regulator [Marinobacter sp. THAF197a]QFS87145.1 Regulatory protein SoxS [Marinobacter sp. THAF197a]QFT50929.1 Regulatory protein SoxS [Marinobacter sp. THAF39]